MNGRYILSTDNIKYGSQFWTKILYFIQVIAFLQGTANLITVRKLIQHVDVLWVLHTLCRPLDLWLLMTILDYINRCSYLYQSYHFPKLYSKDVDKYLVIQIFDVDRMFYPPNNYEMFNHKVVCIPTKKYSAW